jgi:hypothetical protein
MIDRMLAAEGEARESSSSRTDFSDFRWIIRLFLAEFQGQDRQTESFITDTTYLEGDATAGSNGADLWKKKVKV